MMSLRFPDFSNVFLYAVTPVERNSADVMSISEKLLKGGLDVLQLRTRDKSDKEIISLGNELKNLCRSYGALFIMNNRVDLACVVDADGVHLGHNDMPLNAARSILGHNKIIGASTHSLPQALEAQKNGADYVSCGPLWATPTKPEYPAVGLSLIGLYKAALRVPFVAIGGVDEHNLDQVLEAGAPRVAMVRALFDAPDPEKMGRDLKGKIRMNNKPLTVLI